MNGYTRPALIATYSIEQLIDDATACSVYIVG
jgi:hypothetical protein